MNRRTFLAGGIVPGCTVLVGCLDDVAPSGESGSSDDRADGGSGSADDPEIGGSEPVDGPLVVWVGESLEIDTIMGNHTDVNERYELIAVSEVFDPDCGVIFTVSKYSQEAL